jgi:hypothetical protein
MSLQLESKERETLNLIGDFLWKGSSKKAKIVENFNGKLPQ